MAQILLDPMLHSAFLVLWLLPCALQDYRTRHVSNWLTLPAFVLAWPLALWLGGNDRLLLTFAVFIGCWAAWQMHTMGAADGKTAVALAAVSPMALGMGVGVLVGMFAGLWVWKRRSVSVPAAVGFYLGAIGAAGDGDARSHQVQDQTGRCGCGHGRRTNRDGHGVGGPGRRL